MTKNMKIKKENVIESGFCFNINKEFKGCFFPMLNHEIYKEDYNDLVNNENGCISIDSLNSVIWYPTKKMKSEDIRKKMNELFKEKICFSKEEVKKLPHL